MIEVTYGEGGYCENCDPSHVHPLHNVIERHEVPDPEPVSDVTQLADALASLPPATIDALKQALGIQYRKEVTA